VAIVGVMMRKLIHKDGLRFAQIIRIYLNYLTNMQQIIIGLIFLNVVVLAMTASTLWDAMKILKQSKLK
jgi:predicted membrane channel-forming protein YqfA (hemolysin III family)